MRFRVDFLGILAVFAVWLVMQLWVLPRLGVGT